MLVVSTPEQTVVDLVEHQQWGGGPSNVATVISEMPPLDGVTLAELAGRRPQPVAQRLGWFLDFLEVDVDLMPLEQLARSGRTTPLSPRSRMTGQRDRRWGVLVNTPVEPDV
jgi:predicted transcriptional regulator of viral defense system